jgi:hypothetical protein
MFFADLFMITMTCVMLIGLFFMFDEVILKGYFATKLRKRFDVSKLDDSN